MAQPTRALFLATAGQPASVFCARSAAWCLLIVLTAAGCPQTPAPPVAVPPPAADLETASAVTAPAKDPAAGQDPDELRLPVELGLLRQPRPTLPAAGSVYEVAEYPQHTPPLQAGTEDDRNLVEIYCIGCHNTTYISMQPALPRARWEAEVKKMVATYGAAIPDPIAVRIATYLHAYYGDSPLPPRRRAPVK